MATELMNQPRFPSGDRVMGSQIDKRHWKLTNKRKRQQLQREQPPHHYWSQYDGSMAVNTNFTYPNRDEFKGGMCPSNLALKHPAAPLLQEYATKGCPIDTGRRWTRAEINAAVDYAHHPLEESALAQFYEEALEKQQRGLVEILDWKDICQLPDEKFPRDMKVSPLSAVPHKSRKWRAILDLSWVLKSRNGQPEVPSVNASSTRLAPSGAMDQIGHVLKRLIHAVATAPDGKKIYFAKWDVKDGFWQMVAETGAEWNFCYVLTTPDGNKKIIKPKSLQMGFIDSGPFFGVASETARDVCQAYAQTPIGQLPAHKFEHYTEMHNDFQSLPATTEKDSNFQFTLEVYVDDFIGAAAVESQKPLRHVSRATLHGIHDVFPPHHNEDEDPNSAKKLRKGDGAWALEKELLGFDFNGEERTIMVGNDKRKALEEKLRDWLRLADKRGKSSAARIPFAEFRKVIAQLRHAAISVPSGKGLLSKSSQLASMDDTQYVFIRVGSELYQELHAWRTLLRDILDKPTKCTELVSGHPDIIGIVDASKEGVGGVVVGENVEMVPIVFRLEWPEEVRALVISDDNPTGKITNSDLA